MRRYRCPHCQNEAHFENTVCIKCNWQLSYLSAVDNFYAVETTLQTWSDRTHRNCANRDLIGCNWLVEATETSQYCTSCRHTLIIPNLSIESNIERWSKLERAKRLLFYSLHKFQLSVPEEETMPSNWLRFEFKSDQLLSDGQQTKVLTGHEDGLITINIAEADDDVRERHRVVMGEPYRTLIGHFRHEVGHYYWDNLVRDRGPSEEFRTIFGDERIGYAQALKRHYQEGAPLGWEQLFVSSYASSHPWEDFAETWSHYFHIVDGLETAESYAIGSLQLPVNRDERTNGPYASKDFNGLIDAWVPLTIALNAMNRSIGNRDFYPFVLSDVISTKLRFIHSLIHSLKSSPNSLRGMQMQ